jgi:hypothetical protein
MQDLLANPIFQTAFAPLVSSLVVVLMLQRAGRIWHGFAVMTGVFVAILLTTGFSFQPLTSTSKIILSSLILPFSAFLLVQLKCPLVYRAVFLALSMAIAAVWVAWPVLGRQEGLELWLTGGRVALFAAAIGGGMRWFSQGDVTRQGGTMLALGIGVGATSMIAASALYAQLAFAVSAAVGGLLLVALVKYERALTVLGLRDLSVFAVAVPLGLIGGAATVYAQLPGAALVCLALVPIFAAIPVARQQNLWVRTALSTMLGFAPIVPALWLAWRAAESSMSY